MPSTNPDELLRATHSTTHRAWYTNPVRRFFFKILAPFFVHQADMTAAIAAKCEDNRIAVNQIAAVAEAQRQATHGLSEEVVQATRSSANVRHQLFVLDGLRKEQLAVGSRMGGLEDAVGRVEDTVAGLAEDVAESRQRLREFDERLRLIAGRPSAAEPTQTALSTPGLATLQPGQSLAIAGTTLVLHDGPYGRFLLRHPDLISDHVRGGGFWDAHLKPIIERTGRRDRSAIDAGAYFGFHSAYMARFFGQVYSFEPQAEIFRMLCANLALNGCRNVIAANQALYHTPGSMRLADVEQQGVPVPGGPEAPAYDLIDNAAALMFVPAAADAQSVPSTMIDALGLTNLGFLKVDTQGSDLHVLKGGRKTIASCRPVVAVEFERELSRSHNDTLDDYRSFFAELHYDLQVLEERSGGKQIDLLAEPR